jgi:hypothetical protein
VRGRELGRPRRRRENNIKTDMGGMDWIDLAQDKDKWRALLNAVPSGSIESGEFSD